MVHLVDIFRSASVEYPPPIIVSKHNLHYKEFLISVTLFLFRSRIFILLFFLFFFQIKIRGAYQFDFTQVVRPLRRNWFNEDAVQCSYCASVIFVFILFVYKLVESEHKSRSLYKNKQLLLL